ncbi:MAG: hypothetical protein HKN39_00335 [Flavobacteriales bacterium]|nr:hypothetical protein [Flavobacteriales bacterium]
MEIFATYCSAHKKEDSGLLPAIERYQSDRIRNIKDLADQKAVPFFILSGKFGLIPAGNPVPFYDHLLINKAVAGHSQKVAQQISEKGINSIRYFTRDPRIDLNIDPYLKCIQKACEICETEFSRELII